MKSRIATDVTKTAAYHASSRKLVLRRKLAERTKAVAGAAHRVDQVVVEVAIDLGAQAADVRLDDGGMRVEMEVPYLFQQHGARDDLSGVAHQILEQPEFLRLELDAPAAARHGPREAVELEIRNAQHRLLLRQRLAAGE